MKKIFLLLVFPFYLLAMQPALRQDQDDRMQTAQAQSLRPASCMDAILQINRSVTFRLLMGKEISKTTFDKLPPELLVMIGLQCNLKEPKLIHAIDYIADTISGQLSLQKADIPNKLGNVLAFIDSCPLPLSTAIKDAFVKKYRWKYKRSLARSDNSLMMLLHSKNVNNSTSTIILDNQKIIALPDGTIKVTDLITNQEIFTTQMTFQNPRLELHSNPTRLIIKDSTYLGLINHSWTLPGSFDTMINVQQCPGEKRKHKCIVRNNRIIWLPEDKKEEKGSSQNPKKKRK